MSITKIAVRFNKTTVDAADFMITSDELDHIAHGYFMDRLTYEYEAWAERADFSPNTGEWFDYHFAGERLDAIEAVMAPAHFTDMKKIAEADFRNQIGDRNWAEFTGNCGYENEFNNEPLCGVPATRVVEFFSMGSETWHRRQVCDKHYEKYAQILADNPGRNQVLRLTEEKL
jgi:hypothetical protein